MNRSQKFLENMKPVMPAKEEMETEVPVSTEVDVEDEIDTDDDQVLAVLDMYFSRIGKKNLQVKADKLQQLVHRLINSMINMPRGEKEVRNALKLAIKGVNEKKQKVSESVDEGPAAMKFAKAVAKIESKSAAKKAELLSALLSEVVGKINELPQSSKILRELAPIAMELAMQGPADSVNEKVNKKQLEDILAKDVETAQDVEVVLKCLLDFAEKMVAANGDEGAENFLKGMKSIQNLWKELQ